MSYEEFTHSANNLNPQNHIDRRSKEAISPNSIRLKRTQQFIPCQAPYPTNFNHWPEPMKRRFSENLKAPK